MRLLIYSIFPYYGFKKNNFLTGKRTRHGGTHRGHLEEPERLVDVDFRGERLESHFRQRFRNSNYGLELTDGDGNGKPLLALLVVFIRTRAHHYVTIFQFIGGFYRESRSAGPEIFTVLPLFSIGPLFWIFNLLLNWTRISWRSQKRRFQRLNSSFRVLIRF